MSNWYKKAKIDAELDRPMPTRKLGKTGYDVSIFSLGGQGSLEEHGDKKNSVNIIRRAFDLGINYFDTAPIYGPSEDYYGEALNGIRKRVFLASKTDDRTRDGSLKLLEKSLKRLKTDYLDLWQIHHLEDESEVKEIGQKQGAIQALIEMQEQGVVNFIGLTGHEDPDVLISAMKICDFDTVLVPVNAGDKHTKKSFIKDFLPVANSENMGVIGMKIFAQGFIFDPDGITTTWEPISYALSQDVSTVIVGHDSVAQLEENVALAKSFYQLSNDQQENIEKKTKDYVKRHSFFRKEFGGYKSRRNLDAPHTISNME